MKAYKNSSDVISLPVQANKQFNVPWIGLQLQPKETLQYSPKKRYSTAQIRHVRNLQGLLEPSHNTSQNKCALTF